jgi:uncharacterized Zn finger protein (UPF0148 family)
MRGRRCSNCNTEDTPLWRKGFDGEILCNSCGLYWSKHGENPHKDEVAEQNSPRDQDPKISKMTKNKDKRLNSDGMLVIDGSSPESPDLKLEGYRMKSVKPHSPPSLGQHSQTPQVVDLSKMTERQQIAYLMRVEQAADSPSPQLKGSLIIDRPLSTKGPLGVKRSSSDESWGEENERQKRRKKDKPKKNDGLQTQTGSQKPVKKQRKNEAICTYCEDGGNLLMCEGPCLRSFHVSCLGLKSFPNATRWECDDCSKNMNQCFFCKQKGEIGRELMKCKVHQCGKYYHYKCVSQLKLAKLINSKAKRFNCPLHYCAVCEVSGDGKQSVHCFRCPTAYHVICMPHAARLLTDKSKETRKTGLILCPKHLNEPHPPPTPTRYAKTSALVLTTLNGVGISNNHAENILNHNHTSNTSSGISINKSLAPIELNGHSFFQDWEMEQDDGDDQKRNDDSYEGHSTGDEDKVHGVGCEVEAGRDRERVNDGETNCDKQNPSIHRGHTARKGNDDNIFEDGSEPDDGDYGEEDYDFYEDSVNEDYKNESNEGGELEDFNSMKRPEQETDPQKMVNFDKVDMALACKHPSIKGGKQDGKKEIYDKKTQEIKNCVSKRGKQNYYDRHPKCVVVVEHKSLDDLERELINEFEKERRNCLSEQHQPPKQRQKKMDRIHMLEGKFREELAAYKHSLECIRDSMWKKNQMDFETKVELLRAEWHRLDLEAEGSLARQFAEWGLLTIKRKFSPNHTPSSADNGVNN